MRDVNAIMVIDHLCCADPARRRLLKDAVCERCVFVIEEMHSPVGFAVVRNRFFGRPFLELIYVKEERRRSGLGEILLIHLEKRSLSKEDFWTSTNRSNRAMRRLLRKRGFKFAGSLVGLDEGDPEVFYVKKKPEQDA